MSEFENPNILDEVSSDYLVEMWYSGTVYGIHFGWFVLAASLLILYFWPQIQRKLDKAYEERRDKAYEAKCKKDPEWYNTRLQAVDAARLRMQEELSRKAKEHAEKMKQQEEKRRQELLANLDPNAGGNTLDSSANKKTNNSFKPEYHPLMNGGPSRTYRPPRRSGCPGGGCG